MGKKKNSSGSIQKKRREKELKRKKLKQKNITVKKRQKLTSMSRLKDNLKNIPLLALEPEIKAIPSSRSVEALLAAGSNDIERINAFYDDAFQATMLKALDQIEQRYRSDGNATGLMNVGAVKYFMNENNYPGAMNQVVVIKYFMTVQPDLKLDESNVISFIEEFEQTHAEMLNSFDDDQEEESGSERSVLTDDQPQAVQRFTAHLQEHLTADQSKDADRVEELTENFEVFYTDYIVEEKGLDGIEGIKPTHLTLFFDHFFVQNMSPTDADKESMSQTLRYVADMLFAEKIFSEADVDTVKTKLSLH